MRGAKAAQPSDLMLDRFTGYIALHFTDAVGATPVRTSLGLGLAGAVWARPGGCWRLVGQAC
jgi:hypothetical protein